MKKRIAKITALILAFLLLSIPACYCAVTTLTDAVATLRSEPKSGESYYNGSALIFPSENLDEGYKTARDMLSSSENFEDLILDRGFSDVTILDCHEKKPEIKKLPGTAKGYQICNSYEQDAYFQMEVFSSDIQNDTITLTDGRWINCDRTVGEDEPLELLVSEKSPLTVGTQVYAQLSLSDKDGAPCILPSVIVGKVKTNGSVPHALKQPTGIAELQATKSIAFIENPFKAYEFDKFNSEEPHRNLYHESVTFRIAEKENLYMTMTKAERDAYDIWLTSIAEKSGANLYRDEGFNTAVRLDAETLVETRAAKTVIAPCAFILLLVFVLFVLLIFRIVKI